MTASHPVMLEMSDFFSALRILVNELDEEIVKLFSEKRGSTKFFYMLLTFSGQIDYQLATVEKILFSEGGGDVINQSEESQYGVRRDKQLIWDHHMQRLGAPEAWKKLQARYSYEGGGFTDSWEIGTATTEWDRLGNDPNATPNTNDLQRVLLRIRHLIDSIEPHLKSWRDPTYVSFVKSIQSDCNSLWDLATTGDVK